MFPPISPQEARMPGKNFQTKDSFVLSSHRDASEFLMQKSSMSKAGLSPILKQPPSHIALSPDATRTNLGLQDKFALNRSVNKRFQSIATYTKQGNKADFMVHYGKSSYNDQVT